MKKIHPLKYLLAPVSWIYGALVFIRNILFDTGLLPETAFPFPVISVGNITVGGTGKTPMVEYLVKLLKNECKLATLSRGYKRKSRGFILAGEHSSPAEIGDEPAQIKAKFPDIYVAVDTNRVRGIRKLIETIPDLNLVILDDAFQHRYVRPGLSILLFDYNRPAKYDRLLPFGYLRESISSVKRADIIIITKAPRGSDLSLRESMIRDLNLLPHQQIFISSIAYEDLKKIFPGTPDEPVFKSINTETSVLLVCGIAVPDVFREHISAATPLVTELFFPDHQPYSHKEIRQIKSKFDAIPSVNKIIITTEKDSLRLKALPSIPTELKKYLYYIPIETEFNLNEKERFNQTILQYAGTNKYDRFLHQGKNRITTRDRNHSWNRPGRDG